MAAIQSPEEKFDITEERHWSEDGEIAARMAPVIAAISGRKGGCLPQDLVAEGFPPGQVSRCWQIALALSAIPSRR